MKKREVLEKELQSNLVAMGSKKTSKETRKLLANRNREILNELEEVIEMENNLFENVNFYDWKGIEKKVSERVFYWIEQGYVLDTENNHASYGGCEARYFLRGESGNLVSIDVIEEREDRSNFWRDYYRIEIQENLFVKDNRSTWIDKADDCLSKTIYYALPSSKWFRAKEAKYTDNKEFAEMCREKHDERYENKSYIHESEIKYNPEVVEKIMKNRKGFKTKKAKHIHRVNKYHDNNGYVYYEVITSTRSGLNKFTVSIKRES